MGPPNLMLLPLTQSWQAGAALPAAAALLPPWPLLSCCGPASVAARGSGSVDEVPCRVCGQLL